MSERITTQNSGQSSAGQNFLRTVTRLFLSVFTRTTVEGAENVPAHGPLLILANHASTIDAMLLLAYLPIPHISFVGPGDFKLLFPANLILKWYGMIPVKRATTMERSALRAMTDVLKNGGILALFPEGGTWEKPLAEAKSGASYISQATQAPILPVALGGTYRVWYDVVRLKRPHLKVSVGQVLPPIPASVGKLQREKVLVEGTARVMDAIYQRLPAVDQQRYDDRIGLTYSLIITRRDQSGGRDSLTIPGSDVLGEVILKPNLISPLVNNAGLPLDPLLKRHGGEVPAQSVRLACDLFAKAIQPSARFDGYFEYRLGEQKATALRAALHALRDAASELGTVAFVFKPVTARLPE